MFRRCLGLWLGLGSLVLAAEERGAAFMLDDGDRVAFVGNSFFQRSVPLGYLETDLACRWPQAKCQFRNFGWDGDTVFGHAHAGGRRRAVFGDAEEGYRRRQQRMTAYNPTVVLLAYGFNESYDGQDAVPRFRQGLERLVVGLERPGRTLVLLTPLPVEVGRAVDRLGGLLRDRASEEVKARNKALGEIRDVVAAVAQARGHACVDLLEAFLGHARLTHNGIHPHAAGYARVAREVARQLRLPEPPRSPPPTRAAIRAAIVKKNTLFFHRWRPRNDAFVYGERKDEQVVAQQEPQAIEPFVEQAEEQVWQLLAQTGKETQ